MLHIAGEFSPAKKCTRKPISNHRKYNTGILKKRRHRREEFTTNSKPPTPNHTFILHFSGEFCAGQPAYKETNFPPPQSRDDIKTLIGSCRDTPTNPKFQTPSPTQLLHISRKSSHTSPCASIHRNPPSTIHQLTSPLPPPNPQNPSLQPNPKKKTTKYSSPITHLSPKNPQNPT